MNTDRIPSQKYENRAPCYGRELLFYALAHDEYDDQIFEGVLEKAKQPGIMKLGLK